MLLHSSNRTLVSLLKKKMFGNQDIRSGGSALYPTMPESPELRWSFIRKVYSIITIQLLLGIAVAFAIIFVHPIANFFFNSKLSHVLRIVLFIVPFISMFYIFIITWVLFLLLYFITLLLTICFILQFYVHYTGIITSTLLITSSS